jgi:predicted Zn-dependent protease
VDALLLEIIESTIFKEAIMDNLYKKNTFSKLYLSSSLIVILSFFFACATVPVTERKALRLVPDMELMSMSLQQYSEIIRKSKLSNDPAKVGMVKTIGKRIAGAAEDLLRTRGLESDIQNYRWEFNLIEDDKVVNAWCLPGGKVAVYTGILPITQNENGLAVVMGHAIARHGNERFSQELLQAMGGVALSVALSSKPAETRELFLAAYGIGTGVGVLLPYSRLHESEADRIGLILMAKAGYDPREAVPFWQRMNKESKKRMPEFLSTHPAPETRIRQIEALIPEAMGYYKGQRGLH